MRNLAAYVELALDVAAAYAQLRRPGRRRFLIYIALLALAGLMLLTAIGFGLAAACWAMRGLGLAIACILTGAAGLGVGLVALLASRWVWRPQDRQ